MNCREELPNIRSLLMQQIHLVLTMCPSEGHSEGKEEDRETPASSAALVLFPSP